MITWKGKYNREFNCRLTIHIFLLFLTALCQGIIDEKSWCLQWNCLIVCSSNNCFLKEFLEEFWLFPSTKIVKYKEQDRSQFRSFSMKEHYVFLVNKYYNRLWVGVFVWLNLMSINDKHSQSSTSSVYRPYIVLHWGDFITIVKRLMLQKTNLLLVASWRFSTTKTDNDMSGISTFSTTWQWTATVSGAATRHIMEIRPKQRGRRLESWKGRGFTTSLFSHVNFSRQTFELSILVNTLQVKENKLQGKLTDIVQWQRERSQTVLLATVRDSPSTGFCDSITGESCPPLASDFHPSVYQPSLTHSLAQCHGGDEGEKEE